MSREIDLGGGYVLRRSDDPEEASRVIAPGGEELSGCAVTIDRAIGIMDRHKSTLQQKVRRCLCCGHDFTSSHVGNRLCRTCRAKPEGLV